MISEAQHEQAALLIQVIENDPECLGIEEFRDTKSGNLRLGLVINREDEEGGYTSYLVAVLLNQGDPWLDQLEFAAEDEVAVVTERPKFRFVDWFKSIFRRN